MLSNIFFEIYYFIKRYKGVFLCLFVILCLFFINNKIVRAEEISPPYNLVAVAHYDPSDQLYDVDLTWQYDNPGLIDGFYIYRDLVQIVAVPNTQLNYTDPNRPPGATYNYTVKAYKGTGKSIDSNTATVSTVLAPNTPTQLQVEGWQVATTTDDFTPEFSWFYQDFGNRPMAFFRIQVCTATFSNNLCTGQIMWDSGKTATTTPSNSTTTVSYNDSCDDNICDNDSKDSHGHPLDWSNSYHWQVRVWNSDNYDVSMSPWSSEGPVYTYGDANNDPQIYSESFLDTGHKSQIVPFGDSGADWYIGAQGELRVPYQWQTNGSPLNNGEIVDGVGNVGSHSAIALDSKNYPHICYHDQTNNKLKYISYNGTTWGSPEIVNSTLIGGYSCSLTIDNNDNPHIAYYATSSPLTSFRGELMYATKFNNNWLNKTFQNVTSTMPLYSTTEIVVDNQNKPAICAHHNPITGKNGVRCARKITSDPTIDDWVIDDLIPGDDGTGLWLSLAIDKNNNLHLAYSNQGLKRLQYRIFSGGSWSSPTTVFTETLSYPTNISIAVDSSNNIGISYTASTTPTWTLKYTKKPSGGSWQPTPYSIYSFKNAQRSTSLFYDSLNQPQIAFNGGDWDLFFVNATSTWNNVLTLDGTGGVNIGRFSSLVLDNSDLPYISYAKYSNANASYVDDLMSIRHKFNTINTYGAVSTNVNATSTNYIYGVKFHASFSKPGGVGSIKFKLTADNWSHYTDYLYDTDACLTSSDGCEINFSELPTGNGVGNNLQWQAEITTTDANYSPRLGAITFEVYNIPPLITGCSYYPPAIDPGQTVAITAYVTDEDWTTLQTRWCYDEGAPGGGQGDCPNPPSIDWTDWLAGSSVSHQYIDAGIYNPEVQAKDSAGQESNIFMCPNLFVGNIIISWLNTQYGNIYAKEGFHTYGVPCELCGGRNATYLLVTKTGAANIGFISECKYYWSQLGFTSAGQCVEQLENPYNFPKYSLNFRNALGDLKADPLIRQLLSNPAEPPVDFMESHFIDLDPDSQYSFGGYFKDVADLDVFWTDYYSVFGEVKYANIYYVKDSRDLEIPLNSSAQGNPPTWCGDVKGFRNADFGQVGDGLIIIDGDLHIYSGYYGQSDEFGQCKPIQAPTSTPKIIYQNTPAISKISDLASIAWLIKGDLIIDPDVEELSGTFIVLGADDAPSSCAIPQGETLPPAHCGAIYTAGRSMEGDKFTPVNEMKQLKIYGLVMAKRFFLNRHYISWLTNLPAETFINDGRALLNPPPGLEDLISSLPNWQTKITP